MFHSFRTCLARCCSMHAHSRIPIAVHVVNRQFVARRAYQPGLRSKFRFLNLPAQHDLHTNCIPASCHRRSGLFYRDLSHVAPQRNICAQGAWTLVYGSDVVHRHRHVVYACIWGDTCDRPFWLDPSIQSAHNRERAARLPGDTQWRCQSPPWCHDRALRRRHLDCRELRFYARAYAESLGGESLLANVVR